MLFGKRGKCWTLWPTWPTRCQVWGDQAPPGWPCHPHAPWATGELFLKKASGKHLFQKNPLKNNLLAQAKLFLDIRKCLTKLGLDTKHTIVCFKPFPNVLHLSYFFGKLITWDDWRGIVLYLMTDCPLCSLFGAKLATFSSVSKTYVFRNNICGRSFYLCPVKPPPPPPKAVSDPMPGEKLT